MYEHVTYESLLSRMLSRVPDKLDKRAGSVIWNTHSPTAIELQILYIELDVILRDIFGDTAPREFLILRCKERGISPYPATRAVLKGVFSPEGIEVAGKRFNIGETNYLVTKRMADGEYEVECETPGEAGNRSLGTMVPIEYIRGLQSAELVEVLIPGEDEEETEALRKRYFASFHEQSFGGNRADYLERVGAIPGVGQVKVKRVWNGGLSPSGMLPTKAVDDWYEQGKETMDGEVKGWLDRVYRAAKGKMLTVGGTVLLTILNSEYDAASDALIRTVQEAVDPEESAGDGEGLAPIGHVVTVRSAVSVPVTVASVLTFEEGFGWDRLRGLLEAAVSDYLLELRKGWADAPHLIVRVSQIEMRLLGVRGVVDVQDTTVNDSGSNLVLGEYEIPVFGGISG